MDLPLAGKRIGLLTASASRQGGGVFEAVVVQAALIRELGGEAVTIALEDADSEMDRHRLAPGELRLAAVAGPAQIGFAPRLAGELVAARLDLLHLHGIWMYPSRAAMLWRRRTGRPYLISPHGMLDPWITGRGRWKKALARAGYERASWRDAFAFHALTRREADDIRRETGRGDCLVIANAAPAAVAAAALRPDRHVVYLGRIHPKKNLLALVEAWTRLDPAGGARLTIAGWGDAQSVADLRSVLAAAPPSIAFAGPVFGAAKQSLLESARFTVLPSLCEGLPMSVLEGWALGAPAIVSAECNLPEAYAAGAAIDCGFDPASIAAALDQALRLDRAGWQAMAEASLKLASGPFSAATIAGQWGQAYRNMLTAAAG